MIFSYPLMTAIQEISGRIGRTTGHGIAGNLRTHYPNWLLQVIVVLLFGANTINIGADLGAMGDAVGLLVGGPRLIYVIFFGGLCTVLEIFMQYSRYVSVLKWLTLALFAYFGTVMVVKVPWPAVAHGVFIPTFSSDAAFWTMVVAVLGTTISPYLFFWQASQEVEDIHEVPERQALIKAPKQGPDAIERIRLDTYVGMAFSILLRLRSSSQRRRRFMRMESLILRHRARPRKRCVRLRAPSRSLCSLWALLERACSRSRFLPDRRLTPWVRRANGPLDLGVAPWRQKPFMRLSLSRRSSASSLISRPLIPSRLCFGPPLSTEL